ncbi:penicillin-binding protein activator LpoB [Myxococcota bacterium]|nr:penicillin-binding protein activator LpoB [Myxococcota bacterium]
MIALKNLARSMLAVALVASAAGVAHAQDEKKIVAVLPFGSPNDHSLGKMGDNAQPTFVTELVKSKKVRVVDEKQMQGAVKRFELDMTGLMDQSKIKQIGKFLKADYVVAGNIAYTGDTFTMTVHVTNIETLELEMAEDVDFRNVEKMRVAVRTSAKKIADLVSGQQSAGGKHEAFLNIDARHFYDTAELCIDALKGLDAWRYEGEIDSEDTDTKTVHVKMKTGRPKVGMPLQVFEEGLGENDKPIGVVYVAEIDEKSSGLTAKWIKEKDKKKKKKGDFGLGARISNAGYKYRIAVGKLDDEAEDNAQLVEMFRDKLLEKMDESAIFIGKNESEVMRLVVDLGRGSARKEKLEQVHQLGVDFIIEGKFIGDPGRRRADFKVISAATGEEWGSLKFETRI